ncbi:MAG: hypothetical protein JXN62_07815 [Bacteroidales bacterium]|nr:hypothetical protein [Bacteroidales bacterium]
MKKITLSVMILFLLVSYSSGQSANVRKDPAGQWKFEAPYAPEGYTSGSLEIGFSESEYSLLMEFPGTGYSFEGERIRLSGDTLKFNVFVDGIDVEVYLKMENLSKMSGNAVAEGSIIPLTVERITAEPQIK